MSESVVPVRWLNTPLRRGVRHPLHRRTARDAGNLDGYLGPDPFNQRAVYENEGFIFMLSKDIWPGHPCCAFAARKDFAEGAPNAFGALFRAIVDATEFAHDKKNRKEISAAIAPRNYLNQPVEVVEAVLTGQFDNGLGQKLNVPDRVDF